MKLTRIIATILAGGSLATAAFAADEAELSALKKQLAELDQKVRILEREREIDGDAAAAKAATAPKITLGANGFNLSSADTNFVVQLHGLAQLDHHHGHGLS